jgi:hypothetical protein
MEQVRVVGISRRILMDRLALPVRKWMQARSDDSLTLNLGLFPRYNSQDRQRRHNLVGMGVDGRLQLDGAFVNFGRDPARATHKHLPGKLDIMRSERAGQCVDNLQLLFHSQGDCHLFTGAAERTDRAPFPN